MTLLRALLLWLLVLSPAQADPVVLTSGEHDGFTRLVANFGGPVDWQLGRTDDGYALRITGAQPGYDLRQVFDVIGKSRLAAIWAEPESGALRIGIACACHVMPFEFRPGIVVMDLKDGPPPKGSSFETRLEGGPAAELAARPAPRPRARPPTLNPDPLPAVWLPPASVPRLPFPENPALQDLRSALLHQLSRGAAAGVVDLHLPDRPAPPDTPPTATQIRIGERGGITKDRGAGLPAKGGECATDAQLDIAAWGDDRPVPEQFADALSDLTGEFDRPDPQAIERAAHFYLFLGFGAEARQTLKAFPPLPDPVAQQALSLSYLMDDDPDPAPAFLGQAACDGIAALLATLSDPGPQRGDPVNTAAIRRSFSALPLHLRHALGPRLAERLLVLGEEDSARAIRDAILRAPGGAGAEVALLGAEMALSAGEAAEAEAALTPVLAESGPQTGPALAALVRARTAQLLPVDPETVTELEAFLSERQGTTEAPAMAEALTLAQAGSGDFDAAFEGLDISPGVTATVWALLLRLGGDDAFLAKAIRAAPDLPKLEPDLATRIADRLLGLGFGDPALLWLLPLDPPDPLRLAEAHLLRHDGQAALQGLAGLTTPEALALKAKALNSLNNPAAEAETLAAAGAEDAVWPARSRARLWPEIAAEGPAPWRDLSQLLSPSRLADPAAESASVPGPLAKGHQLIATSEATRAATAALLAAVPGPVPVPVPVPGQP